MYVYIYIYDSEILVIYFPHDEKKGCSCNVGSLTAHPLDMGANPRKVYKSLQSFVTVLYDTSWCSNKVQ